MREKNRPSTSPPLRRCVPVCDPLYSFIPRLFDTQHIVAIGMNDGVPSGGSRLPTGKRDQGGGCIGLYCCKNGEFQIRK